MSMNMNEINKRNGLAKFSLIAHCKKCQFIGMYMTLELYEPTLNTQGIHRIKVINVFYSLLLTLY